MWYVYVDDYTFPAHFSCVSLLEAGHDGLLWEKSFGGLCLFARGLQAT